MHRLHSAFYFLFFVSIFGYEIISTLHFFFVQVVTNFVQSEELLLPQPNLVLLVIHIVSPILNNALSLLRNSLEINLVLHTHLHTNV
jgi:hypothetical protein